jgi:DNA-binding response OmpR family regulator
MGGSKMQPIQPERFRLTRKESELLDFLVRNAGKAVRSQVLLSQVFGYCPEARTRTLQVHIGRLREKLGPERQRDIETIFGVGYRFRSLSRPSASIGVGLP